MLYKIVKGLKTEAKEASIFVGQTLLIDKNPVIATKINFIGVKYNLFEIKDFTVIIPDKINPVGCRFQT